MAAVVMVPSAPAYAAPPTPIALTCSTPPITDPGKYVATNSPPANCAGPNIVRIAASNVTLDLRDRILDGDDATCVNAVLVSGTRTNVKVSGGTVRHCQTGILFDDDVSDSTITGVSAYDNQFNGISAGGAGVTVTKSSGVANGSNGIGVSGERATITKNTVVGNLGGILSLGADSRVIRNTTIGNDIGVDVRGSDVLVSKNTVNWNDFAGIFSWEGADHTITKNSALGNDGAGITVLSDGATIAKNKANNNVGDGLFVDPADADTSITKNTAKGNLEDGIDADQPPALASGSKNKATDNGGDQCLPADLC